MELKDLVKKIDKNIEKWKKNLSTEERFFLKLSDQVVEARIRLGLTQEELAKKLGKHQSAIARIENAKTNVSNTELLKIAEALGVELLPPRFVFKKDMKIKVAEHKRVQ